MIVKFNSLDRTERPIFTLCNPGSTYIDGRLTNVVGVLPSHEAEECVFNFNATSELNFRIYNTPLDDEEIDAYSKSMYNAIKNKRLIFMEDIGYFVIDDVNEQYDSDGKEYKDVSAKSVDIELQQKNIPYIADGTYRFSTDGTVKGIFETIMETIPLWTVGEVDSSIAEKYRTFEDVDTSLNCLGFMIENIQEAYECIILFDTVNRIVNVYDQANYVHLTSVHLTKNDVINSLKITEHSDDLYTAITVSGEDDVLIADVNPLGTNTIYNFDYYLDWMTNGLREKVIAWQSAVNSAKSNYYQLNLSRYNLKKTASDLSNDIDKLDIQIKIYDSCRNNIVGDQSTNIVESGNAELQKYGGTPITIAGEIEDVVEEIDGLIAECESEKSAKQTQLSVLSTQISDIEAHLTTITNNLSLTSWFTTPELEELANYIFEGTYKDEYVVITDIMDYSEKFGQMKTLYDRAESQLAKVSIPTQEFDIGTENILFQKEFEHASAQLETGCIINVEVKDGDVAELFLSSIKVNYDDYSLSMTFGNRYNKFDPKTLFNNVLGDISKSANTLSFIKDTIYPIKKGALDLMATEIQNSRDLTMAGALSSDSEEVVIDSTGYTGRRRNQNTGEFDPEQIKITNNNIVFTDDGWDTSKLAIGRIVLGEDFSKYGVNAEVLIGDIIIGNELHIKDSQGQDIMTVIDGRISTEVTEVKGAAAAGTYEYYDPDNSSWSEKNNVDFFGYGISQDEKETDTGIKAAGNNNKCFLNKHNGNLYKSNGTKWVFQKTLSPRFNNYSTIAYTDNKASTAESNAKTYAEGQANTAESNAKTYAEGQASTAESNAIANATNQVSMAKATIASSTLKYDETGITVNYYGYGTPTEIAGATQGKIYLDQNDGYYYTKGSGTNWTKSSSALPLYADQKANAAKSEAISAASADATTKANTAENNAKTAAANAMSKYDEGSLTINYYGFGAPTTVAGSSQGEIYLDQNTGYYYTKGSDSTWTKSTNALPLYADQKATEAYNNALSYVSTYYITSEDAGTAINQTKQEIEMTAAKAVNKYEVPAGITINFAGYGDPTTQGAKATAANQYYLDQETGNLYKSNSSKQWGSTPTQTLTLITSNLNSKIDQTAENVTISVEKTIAESTRQYFEGTIEIKYYGYGAPSANITDAGEGDRYLDQTTGYYYTKGSGSSWTKSEEPLKLYVITARDTAVRMAGQETERQIGEFGEAIGEHLDENFYTKTETKAEIKNDGEKISLEAVRNTVGYTIQSALETKLETATVNGLTLTRQSDGSYIVNGTCGQAGAGFWLTTTDNQQPTSISQNAFKTGQYLIKASGAIPYAFTIYENGVPKQWATIYDATVTVDNADEYTNAFYLGFSAGTYNNLTINPCVYKATEVKQTVSSQLSVMADNISLKVNKNDLVSEINLSTDEIVLKGNRIRITDSSDTTKTLISGSVIQSGNYAVSSGVVTGTRIDLGNGAIYSKNFEINSAGNLTLSGGIIKTSNYTASTSSTKTVGGKINLNVGSTSSDYLFDTANFKITGTGAVVATEANLNSCTINGGRFKVNTSSSLDETSYIDLRNQYTYTYSSEVSVDYSHFTAIQPAGTTMGSEAKYSNDTFTTYYYANFSPSSISLNSYEFDGQTKRNEENTIISSSYVLSPVIRSDKYYIGGINSSSIALQEITFSGSNTIAVGVSSTALRLACTESYIDGSLNFYKYNADSQDYGSITFGNKIALRYWGQNESFCVGISDKKLQFYGTNVLMPSGAAVTSDARKKHNIESLDSRYLDIIKNIEPKRFQYNCNPLDRYHTGYIAQDVEKAMQNIGMDVSELSAFVDTNNDGTEFALRYGEFIPLLHKWIKEIDDRLTAIEKRKE